MKKILLGLMVLALGFTMMGCGGVSVSQEGNKIYIGLRPAQVFKYAEQAANYFGLQILAKDQGRGVIATQVIGSSNINRYGSALVDFSIDEKDNNSIITVRASINGAYDEVKSTQAAREIVRRIVAYLNGFGSGINK